MSKKEINVHFKEKKQKIIYYGSLDEDQLKKKIKQIFKIKESIEQLNIKDEEGNIILINGQIPSGLSIYVFIESDSIPKSPFKEIKLEEKNDFSILNDLADKESSYQKRYDNINKENNILSNNNSLINSEEKSDNNFNNINNNDIINISSGFKKKEFFCHICHKKDHYVRDCPFNNKNKKNRGKDNPNKKHVGGKRFRDKNKNNRGFEHEKDGWDKKEENELDNDNKENDWNGKKEKDWGNQNNDDGWGIKKENYEKKNNYEGGNDWNGKKEEGWGNQDNDDGWGTKKENDENKNNSEGSFGWF